LADSGWYAAVDAVARHALDPQLEVDDLERELAALAAWSGTSSAAGLPDTLGDPSPPGALWWCEGALDASQVLHTPSLPAGTEFEWLLRPCP